MLHNKHCVILNAHQKQYEVDQPVISCISKLDCECFTCRFCMQNIQLFVILISMGSIKLEHLQRSCCFPKIHTRQQNTEEKYNNTLTFFGSDCSKGESQWSTRCNTPISHSIKTVGPSHATRSDLSGCHQGPLVCLSTKPLPGIVWTQYQFWN